MFIIKCVTCDSEIDLDANNLKYYAYGIKPEYVQKDVNNQNILIWCENDEGPLTIQCKCGNGLSEYSK